MSSSSNSTRGSTSAPSTTSAATPTLAAWSVVVGPDGSIYTTGTFNGSVNFDTGSQTVSLTGTSNGNLFLVKTTQDMGAIFGQVFNDLNNNGVFDPSGSNPETGIPNVTVYLDANNNGVLDPGETTATTDAAGAYEFNHLAAGSYVVRQVTPAGWTQTDPSSSGPNAVTLGTGQFVDSVDFGDYRPGQTKSYSSTNVPLQLKTNSGASISSKLTINDASTILDLNLSINVTTTSNFLAFTLTAPDGTTVQVQPGTTHITDLNYHGTKGTWILKMWNVAPAPKPSTLNAWSLQILESTTPPSSPKIGSFTASPNSVKTGSSVTLNASNITLADPSSTILQVAFYLDSNNDGTLETGTNPDTLLGYGTLNNGVWTLTNSSAFGLKRGTYTLFAQAKDSDGVYSDPVALTLTVK